MRVCVYLYVADKELSRRLHWRFAVDDLLYRTRPVHCLVKVFRKELVAVFPPKHSQTPVTYTQKKKKVTDLVQIQNVLKLD